MENAFLVVRLRQWDNIQIFYLKRFLIYHWFCKFLAWTIIVITTKVLNETFSPHEEMLTRFLNKKGFNSIMLKIINTIHNFLTNNIFFIYSKSPEVLFNHALRLYYHWYNDTNQQKGEWNTSSNPTQIERYQYHIQIISFPWMPIT